MSWGCEHLISIIFRRNESLPIVSESSRLCRPTPHPASPPSPVPFICSSSKGKGKETQTNEMRRPRGYRTSRRPCAIHARTGETGLDTTPDEFHWHAVTAHAVHTDREWRAGIVTHVSEARERRIGRLATEIMDRVESKCTYTGCSVLRLCSRNFRWVSSCTACWYNILACSLITIAHKWVWSLLWW
jgi:hypothetical protein